MNAYPTPPAIHPGQPAAGRWSARRLVLAALAYGSVVSGSVAAAAVLVSSGVPVEVLIVSFCAP